MINRAVVLLSAGLDSTVNLYAARREFDIALALTFNYGQKSAEKEIARSKILASSLGVEHLVVELPWLKNLGKSGLTNDRGIIPQGRQVAMDNKATSEKTAKAVWVPNRNGIFLNIAAGFAESLHSKFVIPGFNAEEASTFPDNSFDFIRATRKSFTFSTANQVEVKCFTISMTKPEIAKLGMDLQVPFKDLWPCYLDQEKWCGRCESCQRAKRAFKISHVDAMGYFAE
ncbi:MAG: 7-cyano-7-deazaguanine synthase QueC [Bdellovibrionales bacterium RIFCSPHIGHO2_01_FULL_40_29]|nr:MAG: 7-cyano-7-deazaguanine synthase QueC [Bdellovibrionales bacterium RIFCSPHIGHO2_01_FULL_40_29]OFZ34426.1 MAG: 7-cyano-7-deazaguanine synthase QueC [Bdellovibrionales bacterium RIFCSPHIGHO2_02_FULL_40_15]